MKYVLLFSLYLIPQLIIAQTQKLAPPVGWQQVLGGSKEDNARSVIQTVDHGFLVVGYSYSNDRNVTGHHGTTDSSDAWVVKLNSAGIMEWQQSYGGTNFDEFRHAVQVGNGDFICVGTTRSTDGDVTGLHTSNGVKTDLWVVRINRNGVIQWSKTYGGSADETGQVIRKMADGNYMIGGSSKSNDFDVTNNKGGADFWVLKINEQGNLLWQKNYGTPNDQYVSSITVTRDNKYIISGYQKYIGYNGSNTSQTPVCGDHEEAYAAVDGLGNVIWESYPDFSHGAVCGAKMFPRVLELPSGQLFAVGSKYNGSMGINNWNLQIMDKNNGSYLYGSQPLDYPYYSQPISSDEGGGPETAQILSDSSIISCTSVRGFNASITRIDSRKLQNGFNFFYQGQNYQVKPGVDNYFNGITALNDDEYVVAGNAVITSSGIPGVPWDLDVIVAKVKSLNQIKGTVFVDNNANGIKDAGETFFKDGFVESKKNGSVTRTLIGASGDFINFVDTGTYTTTLIVNGRPYYTISPASKQTTFNSYKNKDSFSIGVTPLPNTKDLQMSLTCWGALRPGFDVTFIIDYSNPGTAVMPNSVVKFVKPAGISLLTATVSPSTVIADTLIWNVGSLSPLTTGQILLTLRVAPPPTLNINDVVTFTGSINPIAGDATPADNADTVKGTVKGSFDPNDKQESHNGALYIEQLQAGQPLTYTVRFQNMGTDTAFNIVVRDTLSDNLDASTIEIIGASHPYQFNVKDNKYCTWTFNNILLPDHNTNDAASNGYLTYRIKPKSTLQSGDKVSNSASIYFDFNLPVQTNTTTTTITITPPPGPPQPVISGLQPNYCTSQGQQYIKILNLPAATSGITVTAKLDANVLAIVAADSTVAFGVSSLTAGIHNLTITYSNITDTKTTMAACTIMVAVTPDVNVTANITTVTNLANPVIITAANAKGGGKSPLFTFAWNNSFTNIVQAEASNNAVTIPASSFALGDNKIYVKMKTSEDCYTALVNIDSITIHRDQATGIIDIDNPGQVINVYPNPVNGPVTVNGLSTAKSYTLRITNLQGQVVFTKRVVNQSTTNMSALKGMAGTYLLTIYDEKKNRAIGTVQLIKK